jgi:chemotaxis protein CheD
VSVRIGDLRVVAPGACGRLVTVGLGSCVGVAIVDLQGGVAGLAHVFLPEQPPGGPRVGAGAGTYADIAIPTLVRDVLAASGRRATTRTLVAIIAGGAQMFAGRSGADVGERNVAAVRDALATAGVQVAAEDLGGSKGRTMRVEAGPSAQVSVRVVGGVEHDIWSAVRREATLRAAA